MTFNEFHNQLVYELVFNNGFTVRGNMQYVGSHLKDYECGSRLKVADTVWQPLEIRDIVSGWKSCGCDCTIEEYFQSRVGGVSDVSDQVSSEDI